MSRYAALAVPGATLNGLLRTCFRCDGVFRVDSADRRVYCLDCRRLYGFPEPGSRRG